MLNENFVDTIIYTKIDYFNSIVMNKMVRKNRKLNKDSKIKTKQECSA